MQLKFQREHHGRSNKYLNSLGIVGIAFGEVAPRSAAIAVSAKIAKMLTPTAPNIVRRLMLHL
jgi:CBS domain containing-hemolysin-like protein